MFRRPPKYHHYWPTIAQMPPLKHSLIGKSEVLEWLKSQFEIDDQVASAVFSSSKQAKYLIQHDGRWQGDARSGYKFWKNGGKAGEKTAKPKQSHDEMMSIPEYAIMLDAVTPLIKENQRNLTEAEAKLAISALWPNDPLSAARRRLALRLYRNFQSICSLSDQGERIAPGSEDKDEYFQQLTNELADHPYQEPALTPEEERSQLRAAAFDNWKRVKELHGM